MTFLDPTHGAEAGVRTLRSPSRRRELYDPSKIFAKWIRLLKEFLITSRLKVHGVCIIYIAVERCRKLQKTVQSVTKFCDCVCLSLFVCLPVCLSLSKFVCLFACLLACLSVCLFVCLCVCLFLCFFVSLFVAMYLCAISGLTLWLPASPSHFSFDKCFQADEYAHADKDGLCCVLVCSDAQRRRQVPAWTLNAAPYLRLLRQFVWRVVFETRV